MSRRKKPYKPKTYESICEKSDTSSNIYESMLLSDAWLDLTKSQQVLYLVCKAQKYAEKQKPFEDELCFTMNRYKWAERYRLYSIGSGRLFARDMAALIMHGFVECRYTDRDAHTKNVYRLSDRWTQYGKPGYEVPKSVWTTHMITAGASGGAREDDGKKDRIERLREAHK